MSRFLCQMDERVIVSDGCRDNVNICKISNKSSRLKVKGDIALYGNAKYQPPNEYAP